jgi:hypothetical protein
MAKQFPIFTDVATWLNKICFLPYNDEELDSLGRLGFDIKQSDVFAQKYLEKLLQKKDVLPKDKLPRFSELNVAIYSEVMREIENSPAWIVEAAKPENADKLATLNPIKAKIVALYQKKQNNNQRKANTQSPNNLVPNGYDK